MDKTGFLIEESYQLDINIGTEADADRQTDRQLTKATMHSTVPRVGWKISW